MYKIVILGCENSHANNFLRLIAEGHYPEIEVIGIYSNEPEAVQKLHDTFGTPIMADFADAVGQVDGVMITARHGDNHYKYAKPYMDAGIPMFRTDELGTVLAVSDGHEITITWEKQNAAPEDIAPAEGEGIVFIGNKNSPFAK